jgi:hypothetical protein
MLIAAHRRSYEKLWQNYLSDLAATSTKNGTPFFSKRRASRRAASIMPPGGGAPYLFRHRAATVEGAARRSTEPLRV